MYTKSEKTTAAIEAAETKEALPEFLRTSDLRRIFGLARGTVYNLHQAKKIRGVLLRVKGQKSGIRLWDVSSVREFIRGQMDSAHEDVAA